MSIFQRILAFYRRIDRVTNLLVGMPSYDKYLEYMKEHRPNETPLTQRQFFKEEMEKKYGAGRSKC